MNLIKLCDLLEDRTIGDLTQKFFFKMLKQYVLQPDKDIYYWYLKNRSYLEQHVDKFWYGNFVEEIILCKDGDQYIVISKEPQKKLDIIKGYMLNRYQNIPSMFLYYVGSNFVKIDESCEQYSWVLPYIKFNNERLIMQYSKLYDEFTKFCTNNKDSLDKIMKQCSKEPVVLGGGRGGMAFDIGEQKVLKLFKDKFTYDKSLEAYNRIFDNPALAKTEAYIYDVGSLGSIEGSDLYYVIMEKMKPLISDDRNKTETKEVDMNRYDMHYMVTELVTLVWNYIKSDKHINDIKYKNKHYPDEVIDATINKIAGIILSQPMPEKLEKLISELTNLERLKPNWLKLFIKEIIYKYITGRGDLHAGNCGITPYGELRFFDPSHEVFEEKFNIQPIKSK